MGEDSRPRVSVRPDGAARRRGASWRGLVVEKVQFTAAGAFEGGFSGSAHLLIAADRGIRTEGESRVEGVVASRRRDIGRTLSFKDSALWMTAGKILGLIDDPDGASRLYADTLAAALII